jgi:hypothetical protein
MSYEDTNCPCGDTKAPSTMLCDSCMSAFAGRKEMEIFTGSSESSEYRRHAALVLISLSRKRKQAA